MLQHTSPSRPSVTLWQQLSLAQGRLHEAIGPARRFFALQVAAALSGPVMWIRPRWQIDQLNPDGMRPWMDPGRLIDIAPNRPVDLLWCAEEVLRSGTVPLMVVELPEPPGLTPIRRLHLAAEAAMADGAHAPIGLLLTPGPEGAPGIETRWFMRPDHSKDRRRWYLERQRARTAPLAAWHLNPDKTGLKLQPIADTGAKTETPPSLA